MITAFFAPLVFRDPRAARQHFGFMAFVNPFVAFRALSRDARHRILQHHLKLLATVVEREHGVTLGWGPKVLEIGSQPVPGEAGARNILRWLQGVIKPAVADALLASAERPNGAGHLQLTIAEDGRGAVAWREGAAPAPDSEPPSDEHALHLSLKAGGGHEKHLAAD